MTTFCGVQRVSEEVAFGDHMEMRLSEEVECVVERDCGNLKISYTHGGFEWVRTNTSPQTGLPQDTVYQGVSMKTIIVDAPISSLIGREEYYTPQFTFSIPGTYILRICPNISVDVCSADICYEDTFLLDAATVEFEEAVAVLCDASSTEGSAWVRAGHGIPPYTYTLYDQPDMNMPKDTVERAIKKASDKDAGDYKEVIYEGFAPHGIAVLVETATDNTTRTVANLRNYFNKKGGNLGNSGTVAFLFSHKCYFHVAPKDGIDLDELELELIDCGAEEIDQDDEELLIAGAFEANGEIQKYLEDNGFEITSSELVYEPSEYKELNAEERAAVEALIEAVEEDDDVQNVFTNMQAGDEE